MSVVVSGLTKFYGEQKAIDQLNFEIKKGEILGLLGPNGAGKTTTMKILTGFMPASHGTASVCGFDINSDGQEVRKRIGYLPEHNPLYKDMFVREYLHFVCNLMKIKNQKVRIDELIEKIGLSREQHKPISALSKGYRQRVGLAQALIHDPDVLILDEPTSGLDPNQLVEIRNLIREFGKEKTVIFSSHIMQEVQALCDRVIILNKGQLIADDPIEKLANRTKGVKILKLAFANAINPKFLEEIDGVLKIEQKAKNQFELQLNSEKDLRPKIFEEIVNHKAVLVEMQQQKTSVENIFQELTSDV